jgi:hypothetical protein
MPPGSRWPACCRQLKNPLQRHQLFANGGLVSGVVLSLGCEQDEGLLVWQVDLAPQHVEVLRRRGHVGDAQVGVTLSIAPDVLQQRQRDADRQGNLYANA